MNIAQAKKVDSVKYAFLSHLSQKNKIVKQKYSLYVQPAHFALE